ncbi:MAG: alpha/beta hydrolase [Armatimonadota bacterium]
MSEPTTTLVFLHYFGGSAREWDDLTGAIGDDHPCLALNLRGHGGRGDGDGYERGIDALVYEVAADIEEARLTDYVIVGHSMGGKVALALAAQQPSGLRGLLLLAPSPPTPEPISDKDRAESLATWGDREASDLCLQRITNLPVTAEAAARFTEDNLRTTEAVWQWWYRTGSREDISGRMMDVAVPVWIMTGSEDSVISPQVQQSETAAPLANSRLVRIPGAGHLLNDEVPRTVEAALRQFIAVLKIDLKETVAAQ